MADFKDGDRVRVTLEGTVSMTDTLKRWFDVQPDGGQSHSVRVWDTRDAKVEVIEEPYEKGAIYEFKGGSPSSYRMAYLPGVSMDYLPGSGRPWVYISGPGTAVAQFGQRFAGGHGRGVKLAPVE